MISINFIYVKFSPPEEIYSAKEANKNVKCYSWTEIPGELQCEHPLHSSFISSSSPSHRGMDLPRVCDSAVLDSLHNWSLPVGEITSRGCLAALQLVQVSTNGAERLTQVGDTQVSALPG